MRIIYTKTDEAPALATESLLPLVRSFVKTSGVEVELKDISLAGRILAQFPEYLSKEQRQTDDLNELGQLVKDPKANVIKLPNISASVPQLKAAISELQSQGYGIPDFPGGKSASSQGGAPKNSSTNSIGDSKFSDSRFNDSKLIEGEILERYKRVLGSAVNPVLREGNSDRRVAPSVKEYARENPHSLGEWSSDSKTHVAHMSEGDFYSTEKSVTLPGATVARIQWVGRDGTMKGLKEKVELLEGEVIDASVMSGKKLFQFFQEQIQDAKEKGVLFSVHLKATMMKVSDPIIFGEVVRAFFKELFDKHGSTLSELGVNPREGLGALCSHLEKLPEDLKKEVLATLQECYDRGPALAMVDSDRGITNLHVPSDVIIDASMPAAIRSSGQMWGPDGQLHDMKAVIPDRSYAGIYQETIHFCKEQGAFDVTQMGHVSNVGLMAKKAEEYGSHDKTFYVEEAGVIQVVDASGKVLLEHPVESGDIWRMCQTKDVSIRDWVSLGVRRARATGAPAIFWLSSQRAHDSQLIQKVKVYLSEENTEGLDIQILPPVEAMRYTLERSKAGQDTISVTGNVLRDYLTDLFPILELSTLR